MNAKPVLLGISMLGLIGCSTLPSVNAETPQTPPANSILSPRIGPIHLLGHAKATTGPVLISMYGDSTMQGWTKETGVGTLSPRNVPAELQAFLTAGGYSATVTNLGTFGTTTGNLLNGTNGVPRSWIAEMTSSTAQIVVINEGLNDALAIYNGTETSAQFMSN